MATTDYTMGTPLGPDQRAIDDLAAIDRYVREVARPRVPDHPKSLPLIQDYEAWRQSIGYWDLMVMVNDTMRAAKAKRDAINAAQGSVLPPWARVEEGAFVSGPDDPTKRHPLAATVAVAAVGIAGGAWLTWKLLGAAGHHMGGH